MSVSCVCYKVEDGRRSKLSLFVIKDILYEEGLSVVLLPCFFTQNLQINYYCLFVSL